MAVPKYDKFMPSIIRCLGDGKVRSLRELTNYCADEFHLSAKDRAEKLPSGQNKLRNCVGWAKTYLKKAGLLQSPAKAHFCLTDEGKEAFRVGPDCVTLAYLRRFGSFNEFYGKRSRKKRKSKKAGPPSKEPESPLDKITSTVAELNRALEKQLLAAVLRMSPAEFEHLVHRLISKMGYGSTSIVTSHSWDEGIDGIVCDDTLGFNVIYFQAKRWKPGKAVGRPEVQAFLGALNGRGASKGIFVTTSRFSKAAVEFASRQLSSKIVLIGGELLVKLMIKYNLGVSTVAAYEVKRIDPEALGKASE